jgi:hypothetical protein
VDGYLAITAIYALWRGAGWWLTRATPSSPPAIG